MAHRRAGKTVACINELIAKAIACDKPNGRFGYLCPFYNQAKDVGWTYLKHYSRPLHSGPPNESELRVDLLNGSRIRLYGADNSERLRGGYFDGIILDEYGDMDGSVFPEVILPSLADRAGWATFIGTPKGHNDFYDLWIEAGKDLDKWYRLMLKASDPGCPLTEDELALHRSIQTEDQYAQEYECSFEASIRGAIYAKYISALAQDRISGIPYDPATLAYTAWDLGVGDPTAIWWFQVVGKEIHLIDFYENTGESIAHYATVLRDKPYEYGGHIVPADAGSREAGSGKAPVDFMNELIKGRIEVLTQPREIETGINAARLLLPRCWFDKEKTHKGVECLKAYRYEYDDKRKTLRNVPLHDWSSHAADAFRYLAMGIDKVVGPTDFNRKINYPRSGVV